MRKYKYIVLNEYDNVICFGKIIGKVRTYL